MDVLFVSPGNANQIYQDLATEFSAIEPPTWALLLAQSVRAVGFNPGILDVNAERLSTEEAVWKIKSLSPRLICLVVYGQNPNSGTVNMAGAVDIADSVKRNNLEIPICVVGSHASALPKEVLRNEGSIDLVLCNEGVYSLRNLLSKDVKDFEEIGMVRGIGYRKNGKITLTPPENIVPQERMDIDLPGYAWDLLPYKETPLDLYRSHFWHAEYSHEKRSPFAALYTSLGCTFKCEFCMINILNRNDNDEIGIADNYAKMRHWSPEFIIKEFDQLVSMGVRTLRISDEMFLLNRKYFEPLCQKLRDRGYGKLLNMWAYSRVDTIRNQEHLKLIKDAGIKWLALGIESGDEKVRREVTKGTFEEVDIHSVIGAIESSGIEVIANYLFGLPGDTTETMEKTLNLGLSLCTMAWNGYPAMALPGSRLHKLAVEKNYELPSTYSGYSFHGYDTLPLATDHLTPAEIIRFRDRAFEIYHSHQPFLEKVERRFGKKAVRNIEELAKVRLKRRLLIEQEDE
jgi:radical SAM superfamily enzyme YgiQ (UPF0313 family)